MTPPPSTPQEETLRLHQANERTMLAWIRTGIALMAFGFAIARFGVFLRQVASVGQVTVHQQAVGSAWVGAALSRSFNSAGSDRSPAMSPSTDAIPFSIASVWVLRSFCASSVRAT